MSSFHMINEDHYRNNIYDSGNNTSDSACLFDESNNSSSDSSSNSSNNSNNSSVIGLLQGLHIGSVLLLSNVSERIYYYACL